MKHWYFLFITCILFAQNDSINLLDEVKIYGNFSNKLNAGYQILILNDSVININQQSFGNLLQNKANLYFKQNGNAMVSSISLRGSNASNTGVYWNDIAINSALNGQTDFNTLSASSFNQVEIRKGAGTVLFGSGAIGGAINLRDKIHFVNKNKTKINLGLGSYNKQFAQVNTLLSTTKIYSKINVHATKSNNDFKYLGTTLKNENAKYKNYHLKGVLGYKFNANNKLNAFFTYHNNDRELSRTLIAPSNSQYKNDETRFLLSYNNNGFKYNSTLKLALLKEHYKFFLNKDNPNSTFGKSTSHILKYDFNYFLTNNISFHSGLNNNFITGIGTNIEDKERNTLESYLLFHQKINTKFNYNISLRKGFSSIYKVPLIYAVDLKYNFSSKFVIKSNYSTNYRLPTFNDLFWFASGNEELNPEKSKSFELGFEYAHNKKTKINIIPYFTKSKDLIQWRPITSAFWQPVNIQSVTSYGVELEFKTTKKIAQHHLNFDLQYAYTKSEDKSLNKQLIYMPFHKANANLSYHFKRWSFNFNQQYNGKVFITTSNTQTVNDFWLSNIQIQKKINNKINIGFTVNNLFNSIYQTVAYRPMPNRNYSIQIKLKI